MEKVKWTLFITGFLLFSSCQKFETCFEKHGNVKEEVRYLDTGFHTIEIHDYVDLYLHSGSNQDSIVVTGGSNLIAAVQTTVKDSTLTIRQELSCKWSRNYDQRYAVHVALPKFKRLKYYGAGNVSTKDTIHADTLLIDSWNGTGSFKLKLKAKKLILGINSGNVDIQVEGETNKLFIWQQGLGVIDATNMYAPYGWVDHGATGNCYLSNAFQQLDVLLYGVGNIYYSGQPQINFLRNDGPGKMIKW